MKFGTSHTRARLLASASLGAALLLSLSGTALAQSAEDQTDEVIATGIRQSIKNSLAVKRDNTSIVEAITAEDIGKLPDVSIAESLARLPGLAAQRVRGRAQVISVRGLTGDFTTANLNGREQVTAGDNRGVEFDQFPSELLSGAVIYKTPDAGLMNAGLAGTIDLQTIRPLDLNERVINVNARYEYNDQGALNAGSNDDGYRLTGTYADKNAAGTVGWMVGVATQSSPTQAERFESWGGGYVDIDGPSDCGPSSTQCVIGGAKPYIESRDLERDSLVGTIQFEPTDSLSITADAFYSQFEDAGILRGIEFPLFWSSAQLQPGFTLGGADGNEIVAGSFTGVSGVIRNDARSREAELLSLGLNVGYEFNEKWSAELDISSSSVERNDRDLETYAKHTDLDTVDFVRDGNGIRFDTGLDYADGNSVQLTDPGGWGQAGFIKEPQTDDELVAIRGQVERQFDNQIFSSVELGVNHTAREKSKTSVESFLDLDGPTDVPAGALLAPTSIAFLGIDSLVSYDPNQLFANGVYGIRPNTNADVITKAWTVNEDVTTYFGKLNIETDMVDRPLRGNVGVQFVATEQSSTGFGVVGGAVAAITDGTDYLDVLPSVNLSYEIMDETFVRVAAARTLARSRMDQLSASQSAGTNTLICGVDDGVPYYRPQFESIASRQTCLSGGGGNPRLEPFRANAFDVSVEKFWSDVGGYVSLALFRKEIDDFIFDGVTQESASGAQTFDYTPIANDIFGAAFVSANPGIAQGILKAPQNVDGGYLQGLELATNIPGEAFFPDTFMEGFGVLASYSYTDSAVPNPNNGEDTVIPGLSKDVANITVYYEMNGFEARVSNRYRSAFLGEVPGFGANAEKREVQEESVVDAQIGYRFDDGPADGLSILFQANNLTNERYQTNFGYNSEFIKDYQSYGTQYLIGLGYKF